MKNILERIERSLKGTYTAPELGSVGKAICVELLGISELSFYTKEALAPDSERDRKLDNALSRLASGEPLQYLLGYTPFCGLHYKVDSRVLIPRPETAELVEWVLQECKGKRHGRLLDIGTGSGCIAITLARGLADWYVKAYDVSTGALEVARENSQINHADVQFEQMDILNCNEHGGEYNVIVANPPYIMESEKVDMEYRVIGFEPHLALFAPEEDPLLFYRAIAEYGCNNLEHGGSLYFEINPLQAERLHSLLEVMGYHHIESRDDIYGKTRMIKAIL